MARKFATYQALYLNYGSRADLLNGLTKATLGCWVRIDGSCVGSAMLAGEYAGGSIVTAELGVSAAGDHGVSNRFVCAAYSGGWGYATSAFDIGAHYGQWHHVIGTLDGSTNRIYVDGKLDGSGSSGKPTGTGLRWFIGKRHDAYTGYGPEYLDGAMQEVFVYDGVLSAGEIFALSQGASPLNIRPSQLKAYWPLRDIKDQSATASNLIPYGTFGGYPLNGIYADQIMRTPSTLMPLNFFNYRGAMLSMPLQGIGV